MARIQVLPLPAETVGSIASTPFVLIIDQCGPEWTSAFADLVSARTGAKLVLLSAEELTVANVDAELHEAAQAAVMRALCPVRAVQFDAQLGRMDMRTDEVGGTAVEPSIAGHAGDHRFDMTWDGP